MRIGFDGRFIGQGQTGNGVFSRGLMEALAEVDRENRYTVYMQEELPFIDQDNVELKKMPPAHANPFTRFLVTFPIELNTTRVDLFHGIYSVPLHTPSRVVLTQVELFWLTDPELFFGPKHFRRLFGLMTKHSIRRADVIVTPSEFIRARLLDHFSLPGHQVRVIPFGHDPSFSEPVDPAAIEAAKARHGIEGEYILTVGNLHPRKNIARLIDAFVRARERHGIPHRLVIVGNLVVYRNWRFDEIIATIERHRERGEIVAPGYVSFEDLKALYQGAACFAFPSLYEGFGLPVLEAMAAGTPVITSNRAAMAEVAGDAASLVDPEDTEAIEHAIARLVEDGSLRDALVARGRERIRYFTWEDAARKTVALYREVCG